MNGKMSKWFTVHNRHLVPGNPSCSQSCSCACASAWPGATFLSRRACVRFLAELKMWSKTKAAKTEPPLPYPTSTKKRQRQRKNSNFIFALREFYGGLFLVQAPLYFPLPLSPLLVPCVCLAVCLFAWFHCCLFVCLLNNPLPPFATPCAASRPRPSTQTQMPMKTISYRFIYLFI